MTIRLRVGGRPYSWCLECEREKHRARRAGIKLEPIVRELTPQEAFDLYPSNKPDWVSAILNKDGTRLCKACFDWKPLENFGISKSRGKESGRRYTCKACVHMQATDWRSRHRDLVRGHGRAFRDRLRARLAVSAEVRGEIERTSTAQLDYLRKLLVEAPPALGSEAETLAYFRGYMAGAKRQVEESERFERLKDLCHRIAAEHRGFYEERLSWAYESLLAFMHKNPVRGYKTPEEERRVAAATIRSGIIDRLRMEGPRDRYGVARHPIAESRLPAGDEADGDEGWKTPSKRLAAPGSSPVEDKDLWEKVEDACSSYSDPRLAKMLLLRVQGNSLKEIGAHFGLTESRMCQILANAYPFMIERLGPLTGLPATELDRMLAETA